MTKQENIFSKILDCSSESCLSHLSKTSCWHSCWHHQQVAGHIELLLQIEIVYTSSANLHGWYFQSSKMEGSWVPEPLSPSSQPFLVAMEESSVLASPSSQVQPLGHQEFVLSSKVYCKLRLQVRQVLQLQPCSGDRF